MIVREDKSHKDFSKSKVTMGLGMVILNFKFLP